MEQYTHKLRGLKGYVLMQEEFVDAVKVNNITVEHTHTGDSSSTRVALDVRLRPFCYHSCRPRRLELPPCLQTYEDVDMACWWRR